MNIARQISEARMAEIQEWEANEYSKYYGFRLQGNAASKRSIPMTSVISLAARFHRLKCRHALTGTYLKQFQHQEDNQ
jgi:hypothetical protein